MKSLSVLIPAYNEEKLLEMSTLKLLDFLISLKIDFEIIICINASKDKTEEIAEALSRKYKEIRYIVIKMRGFGLALREGIKTAKKELITYMPADDEIGMNFIEKCLKEIEKCDFISGSRYLERSYFKRNFQRKILSIILALIVRVIFSFKVTEMGTVKMFKSKWAKSIRFESVNFDFQIELLYWALKTKQRIREVKVKVNEVRTQKESKVNLLKDTLSLLNATLKYAVKLRFD